MATNPTVHNSDILLVDDDPKLLRVLSLRLETEGYAVHAVSSGEEALESLASSRPRFVLSDLRMPGMDGIELLGRVQEKYPSLPVAILTAQGDIPEAVRATQSGAVDFLTKPVDRDRLMECLSRHMGAPGEDPAQSGGDGVITRNPRMLAMLDDARRVAKTSAAVLITGAGGTGKEMLARSIHKASTRAEQPFVAVDCAALPGSAPEPDLSEHFRAAQGGSLFLDEVGDLTADLQLKLLRVLQACEEQRMDVRLISSTHRDIETSARSGSFREDLFYRLNVVRFALPALDQRREDIPLFVAHQLARIAANGGPRRSYSAEAMEVLVAASWPGNVRQLFSLIEQNVALAPSRVIGAALVRKSMGENQSVLPSFDQARTEFTRSYLRQLLEVAEGNISRAARLAGRNRTDFYKLMRRYDIGSAESRLPNEPEDPEEPQDI